MKPLVPNIDFQQDLVLGHQITAALAATTTFKLFRTRKRMRFDAVEMVWNAQVTQDPTNYYVVQAKAGAVVLAAWSFLTGAQGTLAADTFGSLVNSATDADLVVPASTEITLVFTKTGTAANLPAIGRFNLFGRLI